MSSEKDSLFDVLLLCGEMDQVVQQLMEYELLTEGYHLTGFLEHVILIKKVDIYAYSIIICLAFFVIQSAALPWKSKSLSGY